MSYNKHQWCEKSPVKPYDRDQSDWSESPWKSQAWNSPEPKTPEKQWVNNQWQQSTSWGIPGGANMPASFTSADQHFDSNSVFGSPLFKVVQSTPWSRRCSIANKPLDQVTLADLSYRGWEEPALRWLSSGRYCSPVWRRNVPEAVFCAALLAALRDAKVDIDQTSASIWQDLHPQETMPDKRQQATSFMLPLVKQIVQIFQTYKPSEVLNEQMETIERLQAELQDLKENGPKDTNPPSPTNTDRPPLKRARGSSAKAEVPKARAKSSVSKASDKEEDHTPPTVLQAFSITKPTNVLSGCSPKSNADFAVTAWLGKHLKEVPEARRTELTKYVKEVTESYKNTSEAAKPSLKQISEKWGLPKSLSSKLSEKSLLGLIATAAFQAA